MFTIESFCNSVWGTPHAKVLQSIDKDDYEEFEIPKKNGTRTISYLNRESELWKLQNNLLVNFLDKQNLPTCVKGFKKGESYKSFLAEHIGAKHLLRIDIEAFFPSITYEQIKSEFSNIIFCTQDEEKDSLLDLISDVVTLNETLPQGACTSPSVSNIVMARIDQRILKYCQVFGIRYTRYADDLLFSSADFCFSEKKWFIKKIKHILYFQNLKLNYSKLKFGQDELVLNGYIISSTGIRLSRKRLSDIRHVVSFVKQNFHLITASSPELFISKANKLPLTHRDLSGHPFNTIFQLVQYMCGYRAFLISMVDNNFASTPFQKELQRLIRRIENGIILLT